MPSGSVKKPGRSDFAPIATSSLQDVIEEVRRSVVRVLVDGASGSGVVVDDLFVLTNAHVVAGSIAVKVVVGDTETLDAVVVNRNNELDLALLRVTVPAPLQPSRLGFDTPIRDGDEVFVMGYPLGTALRGQATIRRQLSRVGLTRSADVSPAYRVIPLWRMLEVNEFNDPSWDGGPSAALVKNGSWGFVAGEVISVTAGPPDSASPTTVSLFLDTLVQTGPYPGTLIFTIPTDRSASFLQIYADGNVTWNISCSVSSVGSATSFLINSDNSNPNSHLHLAEDPGLSAGSIAALAGGVAGLFAILVASGWHARRRWLGNRA